MVDLLRATSGRLGSNGECEPDDDGQDPLKLVISKSLKRRRLDESPRSMVGSRLETLKHGERADYRDEYGGGVTPAYALTRKTTGGVRLTRCFCWQEWQDSNLQPPVLETGALPIELHS